jgi:DNA-binding response OmpR family regulator
LVARILLIDDDRDFVEAVKTTLEIEGYRVLTADNGETGFDTAAREKPDLIVLDVMMKTMTEGLHVARQLHSDDETRGIPVLMLSAIKDVLKLTEDMQPDDTNLPVSEFLEKPVTPTKLIDVIRALLRDTGAA